MGGSEPRDGPIERLATGIAHDFNNLLTVILGNAQLAALELPAGSPSRGLIAHIESAARRARDRVDRLLAFAGALESSLGRLDLANLVRLAGTRRAADGVSCEPSGTPVWVEADPTQLGFALDDLIDNAIEATAEGAGHVVIRSGVAACDAHAGWSAVGRLPGGDAAFVEVEDTGRGLGRLPLRDICQPYASGAIPGRGLGLAAVVGVMRSHGGALVARTGAGGGSVFRLLLPRLDLARAPASAAPIPYRAPPPLSTLGG